MNKVEYVKALRELADYVESREFPEKIKNWIGDESDLFESPGLNFYTRNKHDFGLIATAMGSFEKVRTDYSTGAIKKLASGVEVKLTANRDVICKKIVVGTRTVAGTPERIIEAEPEREEEIVEWECPESFVSLKEDEPQEVA